MSTRATSAITSRRAKQELVRLLFGAQLAGKGPEAHRKLDPSIYSYADLRTAYLDRLHSTHPDKFAHKKRKDAGENGAATLQSHKDESHGRFVELQDAWDRYEKMARMMKKVSKGDKEEANFTMFGVGCSFSDSPEEREARAVIMDQACRGWFSSGQISEISTVRTKDDTNRELAGERVSLADDDLFVSMEESTTSDGGHNHSKQEHQGMKAPRRSLVSGPFRSRK